MGSRLGILKGPALGWVEIQALGGLDEQIRCWFALLDLGVIAVHPYGNRLQPPVRCQLDLHRFAATAGGDGDWNGCALQALHQPLSAGHRLGLTHLGACQGLLHRQQLLHRDRQL